MLPRSLGALVALSLCLSVPPAALAEQQPSQPARIDRRALVTRHSPTLTRIDPTAPLMLGNGNIAFTADITGLATFQDRYSPLVPLMIQAQWAWHSFPNPEKYALSQSRVPVEVRGKTQYFPWLRDGSETARPLIAWLRENPHRFSLGRLALHLVSSAGKPAEFADLSSSEQSLDLWTGRLTSKFVFDGKQVEVETSVHPELDLLIVKLHSALLADGRLAVDLRFPGVAPQLNPDPADWNHPEAHRTQQIARNARGVTLERRLDATRYSVQTGADRDLEITRTDPHGYRFAAKGGDSVTLLVLFSPQPRRGALPGAQAARDAVARHWQKYWSEGAVVDFSGSTDPRAAELERRVVLSQYLMALNAAGSVPPQEEGLFSNSWNGKFHLEMHLWHAAQFATWGHPELLERSMPWYQQQLPQARARAQSHGARGAWWPKMVGPEGRESPSIINPFIMWQQPSPIYLAELLYRAAPTRATLERYRELVFETAELLATFPHLDETSGRYVLGPPIIPAQEVYAPLATFNPTFELEYFRFGLVTAQRWRERLGLARNPSWEHVLDKLAPLPERDGLYVATESEPDLWARARSAACSGGKTARECPNRDHPSFLGALGLLPGADVDREKMRRTLRAVEQAWDLRQTWGWDFPLLAMTAARLHEPKQAVDFLLSKAANFQFGSSGMTPRLQLDDHGTGFQRKAETYFPSNGGLLLAVGMMVAGWDGEGGAQPGFPADGTWRVRSEGLRPLP